MRRIKNAIPKENYTLHVLLENGEQLLVNMKPIISTIRFGLLEDERLFYQVTTDGYFVNWKNKVEISINELLNLAKNNIDERNK